MHPLAKEAKDSAMIAAAVGALVGANGGFLRGRAVADAYWTPAARAKHEAIGEAGIFCTAPDGYLRFSPHWPNALDEIEYVVASVEASITAASTGAR